jgi:hypothetical protein
MADISKVGGDQGGPRNIDVRLSMCEALLVHQALCDKEKELRKEAWWLGVRVGQDGAANLRQQAQEQADTADRIFRIVEGRMGARA